MNKILLTTAALGLLTACTSNQPGPQNALAAKAELATLSKADVKAAKKDDRGHPPRPMSQKRLEELLATYDSGNNGELTWGEYNDWRRKRFDDTDTNDNGTVDTEEYVYEFEGRLDDQMEAARKAQVDQTGVRFKALDKDGSKYIEWAEYEASGDRIFGHWDSNADGVLNGDDKGASEKAPRRFSTIGMPTTHSWRGVMTIYDTDENGVVERSDFTNSRRSEFHLADTDKNGKVDAGEYLAEFEDRLDSQIAKRRRGSIKQTYVRFNALDDNDDKTMTFNEFQISGKRIFTRWDKNQDGIISASDINSN